MNIVMIWHLTCCSMTLYSSVAQTDERRRYVLAGGREGGIESTILVFALHELYVFDLEANWNGNISRASSAITNRLLLAATIR